MSLTRKIAGYTLYYGTTQILVMAAGIISMPILTRVLSQSDYGDMTIINLTVTLAVMAFSAGLRQAIIRLHGEYRTRGVLAEGLGTYFACILGLSALGTVALLALFPGLIALGLVPRTALVAALLASALVFIREVFEAITGVYRIREDVLTFNLFTLATRFGALGLIVVFLLVISPGFTA